MNFLLKSGRVCEKLKEIGKTVGYVQSVVISFESLRTFLIVSAYPNDKLEKFTAMESTLRIFQRQ